MFGFFKKKDSYTYEIHLRGGTVMYLHGVTRFDAKWNQDTGILTGVEIDFMDFACADAYKYINIHDISGVIRV